MVLRLRVTIDGKASDQPMRRRVEMRPLWALIVAAIMCPDAMRVLVMLVARRAWDRACTFGAFLLAVGALWLMNGHRLG